MVPKFETGSKTEIDHDMSCATGIAGSSDPPRGVVLPRLSRWEIWCQDIAMSHF